MTASNEVFEPNRERAVKKADGCTCGVSSLACDNVGEAGQIHIMHHRERASSQVRSTRGSLHLTPNRSASHSPSRQSGRPDIVQVPSQSLTVGCLVTSMGVGCNPQLPMTQQLGHKRPPCTHAHMPQQLVSICPTSLQVLCKKYISSTAMPIGTIIPSQHPAPTPLDTPNPMHC